jgi:EAL domain-containing protein (putative c-di-GMP-specific phosphodiesterase class I)
VDLRSGQTLGLEALARLRTRSGRLIPATHFIPVAAKSDMLGAVGAVMLADSLADLATRPDTWSLTINAAPQELASHDFADLVLGALRGAGLPARRLLLDVAEGTLERLAPHGRQMLERLAAAGVGLVIDDFGTGPSSLSRLNDPLLRGLKVDGSLVANVGTPGVDRLVRGMVGVAEAFALQVVAEGVESAEHVDRLLALGVTRGQGHFLGAPTPCRRQVPALGPAHTPSRVRPGPSR